MGRFRGARRELIQGLAWSRSRLPGLAGAGITELQGRDRDPEIVTAAVGLQPALAQSRLPE